MIDKFQQKYDKLLEELNKKGLILENDTIKIKNNSKAHEEVIVLEVYYRIESRDESWGYFELERKFIKLEEEVILNNYKDVIEFLYSLEEIPSNVLCYDFLDESNIIKNITFNTYEDVYSENLDYENKNGYMESLLCEFYIKNNTNIDSYFSIFKTDKRTFERLQGFNIKQSFRKYLSYNSNRI